MKRVFEFRCQTCDERFDSYEEYENKEITHGGCGGTAHRVMSAPKLDYLHMGVDPRGNPTAGDKWAKMHRDAAKKKAH